MAAAARIDSKPPLAPIGCSTWRSRSARSPRGSRSRRRSRRTTTTPAASTRSPSRSRRSPACRWRSPPSAARGVRVTALAASALNVVGEAAGPPIGPTLALYWLAAAVGRRRARGRGSSLLLVRCCCSCTSARPRLAEEAFPGISLLFGIVVWGGAWLAGDRTRLRRERMVELEERAQRAEREAERERRLAAAEERTRIARDLHDSAGHAINVILVHAGLGACAAERRPDGRARAVRDDRAGRAGDGRRDRPAGRRAARGRRAPERGRAAGGAGGA